MLFDVRFVKITDISVEKRAEIIALHERTGKRISGISVDVGVGKSSVSRIIALHEAAGSIAMSRNCHCGRKPKTTAHDDKIMVRNSLIDPVKTSGDFQGDLASAGVQVFSSTIRRRLLEEGRKARKPLKKQLLTDPMRKKDCNGRRNIDIGLQRIGKKEFFQTRSTSRSRDTE